MGMIQISPTGHCDMVTYNHFSSCALEKPNGEIDRLRVNDLDLRAPIPSPLNTTNQNSNAFYSSIYCSRKDANMNGGYSVPILVGVGSYTVMRFPISFKSELLRNEKWYLEFEPFMTAVRQDGIWTRTYSKRQLAEN